MSSISIAAEDEFTCEEAAEVVDASRSAAPEDVEGKVEEAAIDEEFSLTFSRFSRNNFSNRCDNALNSFLVSSGLTPEAEDDVSEGLASSVFLSCRVCKGLVRDVSSATMSCQDVDGETDNDNGDDDLI